MANFNKSIVTVLAHEGGLVNNANDPGGATNFGISLYWLQHQGDFQSADLNHDGRIDINDIKLLTKETAAGFYRTKWWDLYKYDRIQNDDLATKVFDSAVNMGGIQAHKLLQRAINGCGGSCGVDGQLGPATLAAMNSIDAVALLRRFRQALADFYISLANMRPKLREFLAGWLRRAAS